ncbi:hypothetical protein H6G41_18395 [Tolypothrix sp. FACHB-123]|nr:hypothetical protein [Tolypothrix sp. FACHB-123]
MSTRFYAPYGCNFLSNYRLPIGEQEITWGMGHWAWGIGQQSTVNSQQSKAIHASPIP